LQAAEVTSVPADTYRILLIEDQREVREVYGQFLSVWGYTHTDVGACAEARAAFKPGEFACSLIDLGLPDGSGMDLLAEFTREDPLLVNVILTGDQSLGSVVETMRKGAFDYLTKPISADTLRPAIMRALAHHDAVRQRATLTQLLLEERKQLKLKVAETTKNLRRYAASCEVSNARLNTLLRLVQVSSSGLQTEEDRFRNVLTEVRKFVPIVCVALQDDSSGEFLAAYYTESGEAAMVTAYEEAPKPGWETSPLGTPQTILEACIQRHTKLATEGLGVFVFPQVLGNRRACTVGMLLDSRSTIGEDEREFLGMCAHHVAAEWQLAHLLQHAAHYASIGSIALELSKTLVQGLTAIQVSADVLGEMAHSEEFAEGLSIIPQNVSLLRDSIREFRELSRHGKDTIETVRLDRLIEQALAVLSVAINRSKIDVVREFETESQCVLLNSTALARTLLDLIANAIRSVKNGGRILLRLRDAGGSHVRFDISLDGENRTALGATETGRIRPPSVFTRDHPSFLLAQRTVHSCAGKLTIESDENARTTLSILLPRDATRAGLTPR